MNSDELTEYLVGLYRGEVNNLAEFSARIHQDTTIHDSRIIETFWNLLERGDE